MIRRLAAAALVAVGVAAVARSGRVRLIFAWYDIWVGAYFDRDRRRLYLLPVPCAGVVVQLPGQHVEVDEPVDPRDDLIRSIWLYIGRYVEKQLTTDQKELLYDIAYPDGDRWWRCSRCDHGPLHHRWGLGGLAAGGPRPCDRCRCPDYTREEAVL